jgi:hypothetical protein
VKECFWNALASNNAAQAGRAEGSGETARLNPALPEAEGSHSDDQIF